MNKDKNKQLSIAVTFLRINVKPNEYSITELS